MKGMVDLNKTQLGAPPSMDANKTVMGMAPTVNATITIKPVQCPVCKSTNPPGVMFCVECGLIFDRALPEDAFGAPAVELPCLVESAGREHQLRPGANVIGRQADIVVDDPRVSRRHAQVTLTGSEATVEDLGSTNGTKVGGQALEPGNPVPLASGVTVSLGGFELTLSIPGETGKTQAAMSGRTAAISVVPTVSNAVAWLVFPDHEVPLEKGLHTFGRKSDNAIPISDPYVSGHHGVFEATDDGLFVTDTGSTNGTVLNDAKLSPNMRTRLQKGDVIRLGSLEVGVRFKE